MNLVLNRITPVTTLVIRPSGQPWSSDLVDNNLAVTDTIPNHTQTHIRQLERILLDSPLFHLSFVPMCCIDVLVPSSTFPETSMGFNACVE